MLLQPYVENAIWHGIELKADQGTITIEIWKEKQDLKCSIEDNGIGRKQAKQLNKKGTPNTPMGMRITQERLELYNLEHKSKMSVIYTDLADKNQAPVGTKVELTIPL